jgi:ribosomal protein L19
MLYFSDDLKFSNTIQKAIAERRSNRLFNFDGALNFKAGDVLSIIFWVKNYIYKFEGLCICLRKKKFQSADVSFILRNVLLGVGLEFNISYYLNRVFFLNVADFKRKYFIYQRAKLYYIRLKLNRASRIKGSILAS